jgi:hypothetical protein
MPSASAPSASASKPARFEGAESMLKQLVSLGGEVAVGIIG